MPNDANAHVHRPPSPIQAIRISAIAVDLNRLIWIDLNIPVAN